MSRLPHLLWRKRISEMLHGIAKMQVDQVTSHTQCEFGKWYHSQQGDITRLPIFAEVGKLHQDIHSTAKDIVASYNSGRVSEAERKFETFKQTSVRLFTALDELHVS